MFIGHLAVGLALKRVNARVPLGALLFASLLPDFLLGIFTLFGLEAITVLDSYAELRVLLYDYPYSHSIAAAGAWTVLVFLGSWYYWESIGKAAVLGAAVLIHYLLVLLTSQQGMPLLGPGSQTITVGTGLPPLALTIIEVPAVAVGLLIFLSSSAARDSRHLSWAVSAGVVIVTVYAVGGHLFGPTPPDGMAVATLFILQSAVIAGAAFLAESRLRRDSVLLEDDASTWSEPEDWSETEDVEDVPDKPRDTRVYPPDRLDILQRIWGRECLTPGGIEQAVQAATLLRLSEANSLLYLGAGLGGGPRAVSVDCGVWVNGFESARELVGPAMELSTMAGRTRKAPINHYDPETARFRERSFDAVFAFESFYTVTDKERLFETLASTLRPSGTLLFTDLVVAETEVPSPAVRQWFESEPVRPRPWTASRIAGCLQALPFDLRSAEDVSDEYRRRVMQGWADYVEGLTRAELTPALGAALLSECELWLHRVNALDDGGLRVFRFHAERKRY